MGRIFASTSPGFSCAWGDFVGVGADVSIAAVNSSDAVRRSMLLSSSNTWRR